MGRPVTARRDLVVDGLVAVALLAMSISLVFAVIDDPADRWLAAGLAVAHTAPLALRRRHPAAVLATMIATACITVACGLPIVILGPGALLAVYTVGARIRPPRSAMALCAAAVATAVTVLASGMDVSTVIGDVIGLTIAWWLGDRAQHTAVRHEAEREAAAESTRRAAADERIRIARELHDVVAHAMSVIAVQAGTGRFVIDESPEVARDALASIETTSRAALQEMRRLLSVLRDDAEDAGSLEPAPGIADIGVLTDATLAAGIDVEVRTVGTPTPLPGGVDLCAFRILQEALTNVRRHSRARRATVTISYAPTSLGLEVTDDGVGGNGAVAGHGLAGMRERASIYGGTLEASSAGVGFRVAATIPLPEPA